MSNKVKRIAIFASGSGSNAEKIIDYFDQNKQIKVDSIFSNRKGAKVLERAIKNNIPSYTFNKNEFFEQTKVIHQLKERKIDLIVLAGFLLLVPSQMIKAFPKRILNIHPSLLPKYGGQGMYGLNVHKAVSQSGDNETGITVHLVNEEFDKGKIISQVRCIIEPYDSADNIASRVLEIEHEYYPMIIEQLLENKYYEGS